MVSRLSPRLRRAFISALQHHPGFGELLVASAERLEGFNTEVRDRVVRDDREEFAVPPGGVKLVEFRARKLPPEPVKRKPKGPRAAPGTTRHSSGKLCAEENGPRGDHRFEFEHARRCA